MSVDRITSIYVVVTQYTWPHQTGFLSKGWFLLQIFYLFKHGCLSLHRLYSYKSRWIGCLLFLVAPESHSFTIWNVTSIHLISHKSRSWHRYYFLLESPSMHVSHTVSAFNINIRIESLLPVLKHRIHSWKLTRLNCLSMDKLVHHAFWRRTIFRWMTVRISRSIIIWRDVS